MAVSILPAGYSTAQPIAPQTRRCPDCGGVAICWCNLESEGDASAETHRILEQDFFQHGAGRRQ